MPENKIKKQTSRTQYIEWLRQATIQQPHPPKKRFAKAREIAHQAAKLLRERYKARRVRIFGSMLHPHRFHTHSDIDLAVEGLPISDYWDAVTAMLFFDPEIMIDLIDPDTCPPKVWDNIEREGVDI